MPAKELNNTIKDTFDQLVQGREQHVFSFAPREIGVVTLASENSSRLAAMQRAEKNIEELLDELARSSIVCARAPLMKNCLTSFPDSKPSKTLIRTGVVQSLKRRCIWELCN